MDVADLREDLELACLDLLGEPPSPLLSSQIQRNCGDVLRKRKLAGRVVVERRGPGYVVHVHLAASGGRVQRIVLALGPL